MNVGRTAPGIVFERLIHGLSQSHTVDIATSDFDPSFELPRVNNVVEVKKKHLHHRIPKSLISIFGINPIDIFWAKKIIYKLKKNNYNDYDLVFSLISFHNYAPLLASVFFSKDISAKLAIYSVDAIPAPIGWSNNDLYFRGVKRMMAKYLPKADFFFSANKKMLEYQLSVFRPKINSVTDVIYNPSYSDQHHYQLNKKKTNTFLYTGGIYGVRKPEYVLAAFKRILIDYPDSTLEFVGSKLSDDSLSMFSPQEKAKVLIHPFTRDLSPYYERCTALLDIDADLPNDVFLSSKVINYIKINRIIITETGVNSPSREIFKNIQSIMQCGHDVEEIANAMRQAIQLRDTVKFDDRSEINKIFDLNNLIEKINNIICNENKG